VSGRTLLVVGAGLVGTSVGLGASAAGWTVWLRDDDERAVRDGVSRGAGTALPAGAEPSLVLVAVPPRRTAEAVVSAYRQYVTATITDVASVKANVQLEVEGILGASPRFIPGHPLAGSEVSGARGARAELFADHVWVLTPRAAAPPERLELVQRLVTDLGAVALRWDAHEHDSAVALTSHLPQVLSSLLAAQLADPAGPDVRLSGQGVRDMTRIAASDPELWTQILAVNAAPVARVLESLRDDLDEVLRALRRLGEGPDEAGEAALHDLLSRGNAGRSRLPGRHGDRDSPLAGVIVSVADRPGELALLFALAARVGVNLADVRIDHVLGKPTGRVELMVGADRREQFLDALHAGGWVTQQI
jgi:prephenate dehydrogenase